MATMNGVPFKQRLIPSSKYNIKAPYTMVPKKITLHNTDNQMPAENEISYMHNNNLQISYHLAIDESIAIQALPYNRNGWHAGDGGNGYGNRNTIGVEICRNYDRTRKTTNLIEPLKSQYTKAELNTIKVVAQLCIDEGIIANNANIKTHNDWNGKWCPSKILNEGRLTQVKNEIIKEYNRLIGKKPAQSETVEVNKKVDGHLTFSQVVDKTIAGGYGSNPQRKTNINSKTNFTYEKVQAEVNKKLSTPKPKPVKPKKKSVDEIVKEVIAGKWGTGDNRKDRLTKAGYNYSEVQKKVNDHFTPKKPVKTTEQLAQEVLAGKHGNGSKRIESLGNRYLEVQKKVDEILLSRKPKLKSTDIIAKEVIAGKWGNGTTRKSRLEKAGYNYSVIQKRVNQLS